MYIHVDLPLKCGFGSHIYTCTCVISCFCFCIILYWSMCLQVVCSRSIYNVHVCIMLFTNMVHTLHVYACILWHCVYKQIIVLELEKGLFGCLFWRTWSWDKVSASIICMYPCKYVHVQHQSKKTQNGTSTLPRANRDSTSNVPRAH